MACTSWSLLPFSPPNPNSAIMASLVSLPYYALDLPCPLPTDTEIDDAEDIALEYRGRRVVQVRRDFVVKFGKGVNLLEGENLLFVRENTNILVP
jgi:hypothetical protein